MQNHITNYEEAVEILCRIPRFHSNHSLSNIKRFLSVMGSPDKRMNIVHIAGTNGKGSTSAYLAALLKAAGLKVGLFTSPHLVDLRERFQIDGKMIDRELFVEAVQSVYSLQKEMSEYTPCFFDMMFFIGMYVFSKKEVDILILETGLGGRLDATNAVSQKQLTLITHIAMDHTEWLGSTLEEIATEKAGIMLPSVPCIVGLRNEKAAHVFLKKAEELGSPCRILEKEVYRCRGVCEKSVAFSYFSRYYEIVDITLPTLARYQVENASLALSGLERLIEGGVVDCRSLSAESIQKALSQTVWQGRMEEVKQGVFLDGAHNLDGIEAFLKSVSDIPCDGKRHLIFSAVSDKDYSKMLQYIADTRLFDEIIVTQLQGERAVEAKALYQSLLSAYPMEQAKCIPDLEDALQYTVTKRQSTDVVFIVGSLYLVGQVKILLNSH